MKAYWGSGHTGGVDIMGEWRYISTQSLTSTLDGGEWSASHPSHFTPRERAPGIHWIGGWVGPRAVLDMVVKRKIPSAPWESNPRTQIIQPIAQHYTNWAITVLHLWGINRKKVSCIFSRTVYSTHCKKFSGGSTDCWMNKKHRTTAVKLSRPECTLFLWLGTHKADMLHNPHTQMALQIKIQRVIVENMKGELQCISQDLLPLWNVLNAGRHHFWLPV
jgi:hypothetical protein